MASTSTKALPLPLHSQAHEPSLYVLSVIVWVRANYKIFLCTGAALMMPILIPVIHLGVIFKLWEKYSVIVDRSSCTCSCWDTVFKGSYEAGVAAYKHVYFNVTSNTLKIWIVTVFTVIGFYEVSKKTIMLVIQHQIRPTMLILLLSVLYPHYYTWWLYFNYWNDDFYSQWNHQLFFSITELISTVFVIHLLDKCNAASPRKLLLILNIAILHVLVSGFDQFVSNVIKGGGGLHQVLRDVNLMIPDILHIILPLAELKRYAKSIGTPPLQLVSSKDFLLSVFFIFSGWYLCLQL